MSVIDSRLYREQIREVSECIKEKNFTILITGASGLIGSCMIDVLLAANKFYDKNIRIIAAGRNVEKLQKRFNYFESQNLSIMKYDVMNPLKVSEQVNYIIHAASNADPVAYSLYPVETLLTNIYGTNNILTFCKEHKETRLLLTSTFETYGKIYDKDVYTENDSGEVDLNSIRSCYPESKRCAEILMRCYEKEYDIDFVIARLCSIYGPTMKENDSKAHAQFIRNAINNEKIVLKSEGLQKRTYCYLMDTISGILTILFRGKSGEAYNVSNEEGIISIAELAKMVSDICGTVVTYDLPNEIEAQGYSRIQNCILDNHKLKSIGWSGKYTTRKGLESTITILKECHDK